MEVQLKPEQEAFLAERVAGGQFASTDDAMQAAVGLLEQAAFVRTSSDLIAAFQSSPHKDIEIEPERFKEIPAIRDVEL